VNRLVCDREQSASQGADELSIVRRFLAWSQRADAGGRAEAASALARAFLYSDLGTALRREAELGLTALLDDPSALVRRALAEALAGAHDAPHHVILALACDQSEVSSVVLARSPVLTDAELVDCAAIGDARAQTVLARRPRLNVGIAAALAEIGEREAVIALAGNHEADLSPGVMRRIVERFGEDAETREALLARPWLPSALRCDLVAATAKALSEFVAGCAWMGAERARRMAREASEQGAICVARSSRPEEMRALTRHLRERGTLTVALLLRGLLSGERALFEHALGELSGLPPARIAGFVGEPNSAGFAALYGKAGMPAHFLPVFRAALAAIDEEPAAPGGALSCELIERVIAACQRINSPDLARLMSLLRRFEAEAARQRARVFAADAAAARPAPPLLVRLDPGAMDEADEPAGAPLLIAAAALEEAVDAPPVLPAPVAEPAEAEAAAPPVELPPDRIAALTEAA
jgi:uncharacterized protein (DUF2336 family)